MTCKKEAMKAELSPGCTFVFQGNDGSWRELVVDGEEVYCALLDNVIDIDTGYRCGLRFFCGASDLGSAISDITADGGAFFIPESVR